MYALLIEFTCRFLYVLVLAQPDTNYQLMIIDINNLGWKLKKQKSHRQKQSTVESLIL